VGKAEVQAIENKSSSGTLDNQVSKARTEIVCALEFYLMKRLDDRSRMKREFQVRFCESLWGKFPWLLDFAEAKKPPLITAADAGIRFS
jgi:hypothetical protein